MLTKSFGSFYDSGVHIILFMHSVYINVGNLCKQQCMLICVLTCCTRMYYTTFLQFL